VPCSWKGTGGRGQAVQLERHRQEGACSWEGSGALCLQFLSEKLPLFVNELLIPTTLIEFNKNQNFVGYQILNLPHHWGASYQQFRDFGRAYFSEPWWAVIKLNHDDERSSGIMVMRDQAVEGAYTLLPLRTACSLCLLPLRTACTLQSLVDTYF
jgi:hypothetical protein